MKCFVSWAGANEESSIVRRGSLIKGNRRQDRLSHITHNLSNVAHIFLFINHFHMHFISLALYNYDVDDAIIFILIF